MGRIGRRGNPSLLPDGKVALRAVLYTCIRKCCRAYYRFVMFYYVYLLPLYLNSTSISLDVLLTISSPHAIMVSQEKERKGNTM